MAVVSLTPKTPWALIVEEINVLNADTGAKFGLSDLVWTLKSVDNAAGKAVLNLKPGEGTPYFNERDVNYNRLDLAKWFKSIAVRVDVNANTTLGDVVDLVASRYGMITEDGTPFLNKATDIKEDTLADVVDFSTGGIQKVTLIAREGALAWYGEVDVTVYNSEYDLEKLIKVTELGNLLYVDDGDGSKTAARLVTYPVSFDRFSAALSALEAGDALDDELIEELAAEVTAQTGITGAVIDELIAGLKDVTVSYNGPTAAAPSSANPAHGSVLMAELVPSDNLYGTVVLGYTE